MTASNPRRDRLRFAWDVARAPLSRDAKAALCLAGSFAGLWATAAIGDGALVGHVAGWALGLWSMAWIKGD